jgi:hypothetical protein
MVVVDCEAKKWRWAESGLRLEGWPDAVEVKALRRQRRMLESEVSQESVVKWLLLLLSVWILILQPLLLL